MREIKFRAIHKLTHKKWDEEDLYFHNGQWFENFRALEDYRPLNLEQCRVVQYAGLKDIFGTEVFEGDIVTDLLGDKYEVRFNEFCAFQLYKNDDYFMAIYPGIKLNVIGNIYENPELLEVD